MSYPGYPNSGSGGYPSYPSNPANPPNVGFSMPQPGMNTTGYPQLPGYPASGYPVSGSGNPYPTSTSPYPPNTSPYPPNPAPYPSYPGANPSQPSYPGANPSQPSYPGANPQYPGSYPTATTTAPMGYPPVAPPSAPSYNPPGYPPSAGYPIPTAAQYGAAPPLPLPTAPYGQVNQSMAYPGAPNPSYPSVAAGGYASVYPNTQQNYGTIHPHQGFDPRFDSDALRKAMKGFGTDEKTIVNILVNRSYGQRQQIVVTYKSQFGKDLISQLKSELSGNFEDVIVALLIPRTQLLAKHLHKATSGFGTAEKTLVEILCTSTNADIREINAIYKQNYHSSLETDLKSETYGFFKRLLISLNMGNRDENTTVDQGRAIQDATALLHAGEGRWGTDEFTFNRILVTQNMAQLRAVFHEYERVSGRTIEHALKNEMSGDVLSGMLAIVACVRNKVAYFAERLHHCMAGAGTNDMTLIRIIVTRSEIDLALVKQEFQRMYGTSLSQRISNETSGEYKKVLLQILRD